MRIIGDLDNQRPDKWISAVLVCGLTQSFQADVPILSQTGQQSLCYTTVQFVIIYPVVKRCDPRR